MKKGNLIQSVERAFDILEALSTADSKGIGLFELARSLGLKPPTVHNLLRTLLSRGYVEKNAETSKYSLGRQCLGLRMGRSVKRELIAVAELPMKELNLKIEESVVLAAFLRCERFTIAQVDCPRPVKVNTNLLSGGKVYETATGRVLMAYLGAEELKQIVSRHGIPGKRWNGISNLRMLEAGLEKIRKQGYAERHSRGGEVSAVAAAIRDSEGKRIAAIGVFLPSTRYKAEHKKQVIKSTMAAAEEISRLLM